MTVLKRILLTPGEPSGIGPDIVIGIAQQAWPVELIVIADPHLLRERAKQLNLPLQLIDCNLHGKSTPHLAHTLKMIPLPLNHPVKPGQLNTANAAYVIQSLTVAAALCQQQLVSALVTGPVHKGILNQAGIAFTGHTEFFAEYCNVKHPVMLFVADQLKVALATTHLALAEVPENITQDNLRHTLLTLSRELTQRFHITAPNIYVCGLNPHAGEGGYLGHEEINIITPVLDELRKSGHHIIGPLPADTIFTPSCLEKADTILAMYHDQALPVVKYASFGHAVNVTLGLPFVRTSVDHGTALDIAGTGKADAGSLKAALALAIQLI